MKLTEGQRYVTRLGRITGPLQRQDDEKYPWIDYKEDGTYDTWTEDGRILDTTEQQWKDLVAEYDEDEILLA